MISPVRLVCCAYGAQTLERRSVKIRRWQPSFRQRQRPRRAPELCIEILSPSNSASEINEKRALYFDAGAAEVWVCNLDGSITFFVSPDHQITASSICPAFPGRIP
jgi:Uma2 family endonuclease